MDVEMIVIAFEAKESRLYIGCESMLIIFDPTIALF